MLCNIEIPNIVVILIQQSFALPIYFQKWKYYYIEICRLELIFGLTYQKQNPFNHFLNMQTFCRLVFLKTCFFASFEYADFFLQTCLFYFCRLVVATFEYANFFCRLAFFIFADLLLHLLNMQTFFADLPFFIFADLLLQLLNMQTFFADFLQTFFHDFWIGF